MGVDLGGVTIEIVGGAEREGGRLHRAVARVKLKHRPKRTSEGFVVVPDDARRAAREGLEIAANVVALSSGCRRSLSSPNPYFAFEAESVDEREWLSDSGGVLGGLDGVAINSTRHTLDMDHSVLNALTDRWDGVALLAEAFAAERGTGRFIDCIRLFERAFRVSVGQLTDPLSAFLDPRFGYDTDEIDHWTKTLRAEAAHADQRATFVMDADVRRYLHRVEQAAWDVLLNKNEWRSASTTRRDVWNPTAATTSPSAITAVVGSTLPLLGQLVDRWEEFPLDLDSRLRSPDSWWPGTQDKMGTGSNSFTVVEAEDWLRPSE
jgi:hypothetical protein